MPKLWGDNYFNPKTKKWSTKATDADGKQLERGFNMVRPALSLSRSRVHSSTKTSSVLTPSSPPPRSSSSTRSSASSTRS